MDSTGHVGLAAGGSVCLLMNARQDQPRQRLPLTDLDAVRLDPVLSPMPTVVEGVRDVVSDRRPAVLSGWQQRALRGTLPRRALRALGAFRPTSMPSDGGPNPIMKASPRASMREEIDQLAASDPDALGLAVEQGTKAGRPTGPWMALHRDPAGWLEDYITGVQLVWAEVRPLWHNARGRLEQELERLQVASSRDAGGQLAAHGGLPGQIENGALALPSHTRDSGRLSVANSVRLVPLLADRPAGGWGDDNRNRLLDIRYPLPTPQDRALPDAAAPDSLEAVLGGPRTAVLTALEHPRNAGQIAERLFLTPSGVSHHLSALEAAGLVTRTRDGRHVLVRRTPRANALLALYDRA